MNIEQKVRMLLAYSGKSQAEIAKQLNTSPQNFAQKLKRNALKFEDLQEIASICDCEFVCVFRTKDGTEI